MSTLRLMNIWIQVRKEHIEKLEKSDPKLAEKLKELYNHGEDSES